MADAFSAETQRLFPHHDTDRLAEPSARGFVIGRLLEEGDRADLRALWSRVSEDELADWIARNGWRLSRRSRLFWQWLAGVDGDRDAGYRELREAIWPL